MHDHGVSDGGPGEGEHRVVEVHDTDDGYDIVCSCGFRTGGFTSGRAAGEAWDAHAEGRA